MEDEKEVSQEKVSPDKTGDKDLTSAYEEKLEKKVEDVEKQIEKGKDDIDKEEDQRERSRLGRRMKNLETDLSEIKDLLVEMRSSSRRPETQPHGTSDDDIPEILSTPEDAKKVYRKMRKEEEEAKEKYSNVYGGTFRKIGLKDDPENYTEIFNEMFNNFNEIKTGDPLVDAEMNYYRAKASISSKKTATPVKKGGLRNEKATASTDVSVSNRSDTTNPKTIDLDDFAKEFMNKTGMDEKSVREALGGETPIHLTSRR